MTPLFKKSVIVFASTLFACSSALAKDMTLQEVKTLNHNISVNETFIVEAGAGNLKIVAGAADTVNVTAEIYQYEAHDNYCLSLKPSASSLKLKSGNCDHQNNNYSTNEYQTRINLIVQVPSSIALDISDGSGAIDIDGILSAHINDGSGEIVIKNVQGGLTINDGSGGITLTNIADEITINDGSGGIQVADVGSNIEINDGSGSIEVAQVKGHVSISDGSGSISVDGAESFKLVNDGSGGVDVKNVRGDVSLQ